MDEVQTSPLVSVDIVVPAETPTSDKRVSPNITYVIDQQKQSSFVVNPLGANGKGTISRLTWGSAPDYPGKTEPGADEVRFKLPPTTERDANQLDFLKPRHLSLLVDSEGKVTHLVEGKKEGSDKEELISTGYDLSKEKNSHVFQVPGYDFKLSYLPDEHSYRIDPVDPQELEATEIAGSEAQPKIIPLGREFKGTIEPGGSLTLANSTELQTGKVMVDVESEFPAVDLGKLGLTIENISQEQVRLTPLSRNPNGYANLTVKTSDASHEISPDGLVINKADITRIKVRRNFTSSAIGVRLGQDEIVLSKLQSEAQPGEKYDLSEEEVVLDPAVIQNKWIIAGRNSQMDVDRFNRLAEGSPFKPPGSAESVLGKPEDAAYVALANVGDTVSRIQCGFKLIGNKLRITNLSSLNMTVLQSNKEQGLLLNKLDPSRRDQSRPLPFSYNELDLPTTLGETIYVYVKSENGIIATSFKFQYDSDIGKVVMKRS